MSFFFKFSFGNIKNSGQKKCKEKAMKAKKGL